MVKLAQRMTANFCTGVSGSAGRRWEKLHVGSLGDDMKVMTRKNEEDPSEPPGVVLSAATSLWLPVSSQRLFDFLRDERFRCEWDILSNGGSMHQVLQIPKGQYGLANSVSLLRANVRITLIFHPVLFLVLHFISIIFLKKNSNIIKT